MKACEIETHIYILNPIQIELANVTSFVPCYHYVTTPRDLIIGAGPVVWQWLLAIIFILFLSGCALMNGLADD